MKAYKIMARSGTTRVQRQDLSGAVVTDLKTAWELAQQLALKQCDQTNTTTWIAVVEEYVVGHRPGSELARSQ
jgi:hypothetical protein